MAINAKHSSSSTPSSDLEVNAINHSRIEFMDQKGGILTPEKPTLSDSNPPSLIEELKRKFDELNVLRTSAAESMLAEYKISSNARIAAAEKLIDALRKENAKLVEENQRKSQTTLNESTNLEPASSGLDSLQNLVDLYETFSGLQIKADVTDETLWHCSLQGRVGVLTFDLKLQEESSQFSYRPTMGRSGNLLSILPAYFLEEIMFDVDQLNLFFWRAMNFLMTAEHNAVNRK